MHPSSNPWKHQKTTVGNEWVNKTQYDIAKGSQSNYEEFSV